MKEIKLKRTEHNGIKCYKDGRKIIRRTYLMGCNEEFQENGKFIADGEFADRHIAYSLLDDNNEIIEEHQAMFAQMRIDGKMIMYRI